MGKKDVIPGYQVAARELNEGIVEIRIRDLITEVVLRLDPEVAHDLFDVLGHTVGLDVYEQYEVKLAINDAVTRLQRSRDGGTSKDDYNPDAAARRLTDQRVVVLRTALRKLGVEDARTPYL